MVLRAKEILAAALKATNLSQAKAAKKIGMPEQSLGQKINVRESVRANELFDILEAIGIGAVFFVKATGELLLTEEERGTRLVGVSDGVVYDTMNATLVSTSFFADGENEFGKDGRAQDLYIDGMGRYFVAEYCNDGSIQSRVRSVPVSMAEAFINMYGRKEP